MKITHPPNPSGVYLLQVQPACIYRYFNRPIEASITLWKKAISISSSNSTWTGPSPSSTSSYADALYSGANRYTDSPFSSTTISC